MMSQVLRIYNALAGKPFGKWLFSRILCFKAPYFRTIKPRFAALRPGYGEIRMRNRRAVQNHLKSVHAIAMCNMCELVGGTTLEVSIPAHLRWIPRGMTVQYRTIARSDLTGTCAIPDHGAITPGTLPVSVSITDTRGTEVFSAVIDMHISERKRT